MATKTSKTSLFTGDPAHLGDMMTSILRAQAHMMDSILKQNIETLDFLKARFEKDRVIFNQLAASTDPAQAMELVHSFWNRSVKDYTDEAGKLGALAAVTAEQLAVGIAEEATALAGGAPRRQV